MVNIIPSHGLWARPLQALPRWISGAWDSWDGDFIWWWLNHIENMFFWEMGHLPSGKLLHNYGKSPFYSWENPLFQWPFSIANCQITRGYFPYIGTRLKTPTRMGIWWWSGGDWLPWLDYDFPLGMSSSQLLLTPSFFRGVVVNHQPYIYIY